MAEYVIIDGNNLLHAMHAHAPLPHIGRETLVRVIERWARRGDNDVTLVFDGPTPRGGLGKQMSSSRITVRFSAPETADDVIVERIRRTRAPTGVRVVSGDTAIRHEARGRRCQHTDVVAFVAELFAAGPQAKTARERTTEKPRSMSPAEAQEWTDIFGDVADPGDESDYR